MKSRREKFAEVPATEPEVEREAQPMDEPKADLKKKVQRRSEIGDCAR